MPGEARWDFYLHAGLADIFMICLSLFKTFLCQEFYTNDPKTFIDYGRIINQWHFKRIMALMEGSTVAIGAGHDESQCYIGEKYTYNYCGETSYI